MRKTEMKLRAEPVALNCNGFITNISFLFNRILSQSESFSAQRVLQPSAARASCTESSRVSAQARFPVRTAARNSAQRTGFLRACEKRRTKRWPITTLVRPLTQPSDHHLASGGSKV